MGLEDVDHYETIREPLTIPQLREFSSMIESSEILEWGDLNHVVILDTEIPVGYMSDDFVQLCFPRGRAQRIYAEHHSHIKRITESL